ncbi:hypothetical protein HDU97_006225 [Phlyctochytrium planicorne]|nr:hypothetical protein HDU97_006225 [Phlyctochytrium planicorne]
MESSFSSLLRPTETVVVSAELQAKNDSGKVEKVTLAIIESITSDGAWVFVGSWNVNGNFVSEELNSWLDCDDKPDLYILGFAFSEKRQKTFIVLQRFQELDLSTEAYILSDRTKEDEWCAAIERSLGSTYVKVGFYVEKMSLSGNKVASKQLVGMLVVVYLSESHAGRISEISCEAVGTGLLGMMGNKGAVGCRVRFYDSYLTFINSHLAADTNQVDRRNQDFSEICRRLQFPFNPPAAVSPLHPSAAPPANYGDYRTYVHRNPWVMNPVDVANATAIAAAVGTGGQEAKDDEFGNLSANLANKSSVGIFDSDHIFWFGDLNYRVPLSDTDAKSMLDEGKVKDLLLYDQLLQEKRLRRAFTEFEESEVLFMPSYKFDVGTSRYDTSEKRRAPSWCDRILWYRNSLRAEDNTWIKCHWYKSSMDLTLSDHKPVMALFSTKIRKIDRDRLATVQDEVNRELDRLENDSLPVLHIDSNVLDFGTVGYMQPITKSIVLENTGKVISSFKLVPKPGEEISKRPWCFVTPDRASLLPGERLKVNVTIFVNNGTVASLLNFNDDVLEDLLILRSENSRDHFLAVSGTWLPSSFGNDVATLCRLVEPVRSYSVKSIVETYKKTREESEKSGTTNPTATPLITLADSPTEKNEMKQLSIPKEIWRLIDFVFRFGMDVNGLFERRGDPKLTEYFRECLDTGAEFDIEGLLLDSVSKGQVKRNDSTPFNPNEDDTGSISTNTDSLATFATNLHISTPTPLDGANLIDVSKPGTILPLPKKGLGRAASIHAAAETLLDLLSGLKDPIIPHALHQKCLLEGYLSFAAAKGVLKGGLPAGKSKGGMSTAHHNLFVYVVSFLKELTVSHSGEDPLTADKLAKIFSPILLRSVHASGTATSPMTASSASVNNSMISMYGDKRASISSTLGIGSRLESLTGSNNSAGGAFSNEARQKMFLMHFLGEGNEI